MSAVSRGILVLALVTGFGAVRASAQELSWAAKMFDSQTVDFGVVARGAETTYRLELENIYKEQVHISNVRTTCGCSAASPSKTTLASREKAYIEIKMDTERFTRRKDSNVIVTFDAPYYAEVRIPLTAYIRTDVVLTPGAANFGAVPQGEPAKKVIEIAYAGRDDWKIKEVKSPNKFITAEVKEISRNGGQAMYQLAVTLAPNTPPGTIHQHLKLITDDQNSPTVPVLLEATVESEFTATPGIVALGQMTTGSSKTLNLVVRGRKPFAISSVKCAKDYAGMQVQIPDTQKPVHVLPIKMTAAASPGAFENQFVITIAGREEPVKVRVYGEFVQ